MKVITRSELPGSDTARDLVGADHGLPVTFIFIDMKPGQGPSLHRHPYAEAFVLLEGEAAFTVGEIQRRAVPGEVVVAEAGEPHGFVASGDGRLRLVAIHMAERFDTEWLERG